LGKKEDKAFISAEGMGGGGCKGKGGGILLGEEDDWGVILKEGQEGLLVVKRGPGQGEKKGIGLAVKRRGEKKESVGYMVSGGKKGLAFALGRGGKRKAGAPILGKEKKTAQRRMTQGRKKKTPPRWREQEEKKQNEKKRERSPPRKGKAGAKNGLVRQKRKGGWPS